MKHLANSVLDYLLNLNFGDENEFVRDQALRLLETLVTDIETRYTDNEKFALSDAAALRLEQNARELESPEYLGVPSLTEEQVQFLQSVAAGRFGGLDESEELQ